MQRFTENTNEKSDQKWNFSKNWIPNVKRHSNQIFRKKAKNTNLKPNRNHRTQNIALRKKSNRHR